MNTVYVVCEKAQYTDGWGYPILVSKTKKGILKWVKKNRPTYKRNIKDFPSDTIVFLDDVASMILKCSTSEDYKVESI